MINKLFIELKDQEWKSFKLEEDTTIFIKSLFTIDSYSIIITDLNLVWFKYSNLENIKSDKDEFNEHLDSPIEKILDILRDSIKEGNGKDTTYKLIRNHYKLSLSLLKKISFYSFKWVFKCEPIEDIIDSNSWKIHSDWIKDNFIVPMMFLCKNLFDSKELLANQLDKVLKYVNSNANSLNSSITSSNSSNLNNSSLSTSLLVGDSKRLNNSSKRIGVNIYQAIPILSESIKQEDFKDNHYLFFKDPIFQQYYDYLNSLSNNNNNNSNNSILEDDQYYNSVNNLYSDCDYNNQENIDLNETVEENFLDSNNSSNSLVSSKTKTINKTSSSATVTSTATELSLFYDVCTTPKKNYSNNKNSRNKTNSNTSIFASLPSSISNINSNSLSSQSSYNLSQNYYEEDSNEFNNNNNHNNNNNKPINNNNQFESNEDEEIEEKKRKLELEEKLEQSKQKQLIKKKKTKFV